MVEVIGSALFCEDIRDEIGGQDSFIGVYPEAIAVRRVPAKVFRICVVVNFREARSENSKHLKLMFSFPNSSDPITYDYDLNEMRAEPDPHGNPNILDIRIQSKFHNIPIESEGRITVMGNIDGRECDFGSIPVIIGKQ